PLGGTGSAPGWSRPGRGADQTARVRGLSTDRGRREVVRRRCAWGRAPVVRAGACGVNAPGGTHARARGRARAKGGPPGNIRARVGAGRPAVVADWAGRRRASRPGPDGPRPWRKGPGNGG